jgi:broad-specificity NMP kinase
MYPNYPLSGETLKYYTDLFVARGDNPIMTLKRRLDSSPNGKLQILFSGYRGCGKSTELNKLAKQIEQDFVVLNLQVLKELDPININYVEIFILTMEKLCKAAEKFEIDVSDHFLDSIKGWVNSEEVQKIRSFSADLQAEAGIETKIGIPWLSNFFSKIRIASNLNYSAKKTIIEAVEHKLSDLIDHCNDLIREVKLSLPDINKKGLVILIEDLDKLDLAKSEELFFEHSNILTSLHTHIVFTFPIALRHHPKSTTIKGNFQEDFELPMVKIKDKQGNHFEAGRNGLYQLITARIDKTFFENDALIYKFIDISGGCIRDLFRLIVTATDNALNNERTQITEADYYKSFVRLKRGYRDTIAEKTKDNKVIVSVSKYYDTLVAVANSPIKQVENTEAALDLRQNLCILGYNDEGWCDVHPIVREILKEEGRI